MIGDKPVEHGRRAWQQVYRALEHKNSKANCKNKALISKFPKEIREFADHFVQMQERRHQSDYDPLFDVQATELEFDIATTKTALSAFRSAKEIDRRAFCAFILFQNREDPLRTKLEQDKVKVAKDEQRREQAAPREASKVEAQLLQSPSSLETKTPL